MSDTTNPPSYRLKCACGLTEEYRSELVAQTFADDHAEDCFNTPEVEAINDE